MVDELAYYDENIPCLAACPVHTNAGMYVAAIADGDDQLAYLTARLPNPFASVCGRVCAAPCEDACRRGAIDRPIAIRALKRFVTEQYGPEAGDGSTWERVAAPPAVERSESIGIVGGGPAGMACAHDLRRLGYRVTVYEATDRLGGAMWLGIPEYRLDRGVLAADIDAIVGLGIEVAYETRLGVDVTLDELRRRHDAVFLGIGATLGRGLDIEGADGDGVFKAIEVLINMNRGFAVDVGERVVVIGGGDVAMDAARTALRAAEYSGQATLAPGAPAGDVPAGDAPAAGDVPAGDEPVADVPAGDVPVADGGDRPDDRAEDQDDEADEADQRSAMTEAIDAARSAARAGARQVTVVSLEAREEMPAHEFEVEEARHEGIDFVPRRGPARIVLEGGRVVGLETIGVTSVFDERGRFAPEFDESDRRTFEADTVILAIGQAIDLDALGADGPEVSPRRTIRIDEETGATSLADVWSGGDAAKGPRTLIDAVADGRRSAAAIHQSFGGETPDPEDGVLVRLDQFHRLDDGYDQIARVPVPTLDTGRRIGLAEVELASPPSRRAARPPGACAASPTSCSTSTGASCAPCARTCAPST
jgi:formate dehydrogenase beta subunit